LLDELERRS